jgi:hypothetical protein
MWGATLLGETAAAAAGGTVTAAVGGAFLGAVAGGLTAAVNGGNASDVLRGAVVGGVSGALTAGMHSIGGNLVADAANVVGHGVIGGASNVALGGKFQDGFLSAAASAATAVTGLTDPNTSPLNMAGRTAIASIAGGTASALGGGKFTNGAVTGAMTHLLNAEGQNNKKAFLVGVDQSKLPPELPLKYRGVGYVPYVDKELQGMYDAATAAGYEVYKNADVILLESLWKSKVYSEIVYYNHGKGGGLYYDYKEPRGIESRNLPLTRLFDIKTGFAQKITIACCQYNTVVNPHINYYANAGITLRALGIPQYNARGDIERGDAFQGLTNYFNGQNK